MTEREMPTVAFVGNVGHVTASTMENTVDL